VTILRFDLQAGGWRAVPPPIFEDARLSLDTRGVVGFVITRSDSFQLTVSGLCRLLRLGEDRWRRISAELTNAGYLRRIIGKDERGRFRHELLFSPIPSGGFPSRNHKGSRPANPKSPDQPGPATPGLGEPSPADSGSTRESVDQKSDHHHHPRTGGGGDAHELDIPELWRRAAEFEIEVEEQLRPVRNRGGLLTAILARYRTNGGPGADVLDSLKAKEAAQVDRAARAAEEERKAQEGVDRERAEAMRCSAAEAVAVAMSRDERVACFEAATQGMVSLMRVAGHAQRAFIEEGKLLPSLARGRLIEALVGR
jgi:hypothetical protein